MAEAVRSTLVLPIGVVNKVDVGRLLREMEALDNYVRQAEIRDGKAAAMPRMSGLFNELVTANNLKPLEPADRAKLRQFLELVKTQAPVLHMSFSTEASPTFMAKLITWLRQKVHPLVLVQAGLQPNIGAGCVVRTTNKFFDFSLRQRFTEKREQLVYSLQGVTKAAAEPATATPKPEPAAVPESPAVSAPSPPAATPQPTEETERTKETAA